ncbi:hypothetical protein BPTFM16_00142 [Altererythrobacter insulae]|nr:hypothetical protein BPTFM16_00142 [Altererythrobacter insulae]
MKFDMGQAWTEAVALLSNNRDLVIVLAGVFLFLPSLVLGVFAPGTELEAAAGDPDQLQAALAAFFNENWLLILVYTLISGVGTLSMLALLGRPQRPTVGEAIMIGVKALIPYIVATIIIGLIVGLLASIVGAIGAIGGAAVAVILAMVAIIFVLLIFFRLILVGPIMAIEDTLNPIAAIRRSWSLIKGNTRYVAAFMVLLVIALLVLSLVVGMVFGVIGALVPSGTVALWVTALFDSLVGAIGSTVFLAIYAAIHRQLTNGTPDRISETFD